MYTDQIPKSTRQLAGQQGESHLAFREVEDGVRVGGTVDVVVGLVLSEEARVDV